MVCLTCTRFTARRRWGAFRFSFARPAVYHQPVVCLVRELVAIGEMWVSMCFLRPPTAGAADPLGRIHLFGEPSAGVEYRFAPLDPYDGCLTCHQSTCIVRAPSRRPVISRARIMCPFRVFDPLMRALRVARPSLRTTVACLAAWASLFSPQITCLMRRSSR